MLTRHCYGLVAVLLTAIPVCAPRAGTYTVLYSFTGGTDGGEPIGGVIQDTAGNLYGVTAHGAMNCADAVPQDSGCGTVYKLAPNGRLTTLATFNGANGANGQSPLTLIGQTLYGSAQTGGRNRDGLLFSVRTDGTGFRILHQFSGTDGQEPFGALRAGPGGVGYGVTLFGGQTFRKGVLFEIAADGTYTILHQFAGADGNEPLGIVVDASGNIFGTTEYGGPPCPSFHLGCGVVFEFVPSTGAFTLLHDFTGAGQDIYPTLGSIGADGTLYGATEFGTGNYGTLFSLGTSGAMPFTTLTTFYGSNGQYPPTGPLLNPDGSLTGTTVYGGVYSSGILYHFAAGALTTTYSFGSSQAQGYEPDALPIMSKTGSIIGTTTYGGVVPCSGSGTFNNEGCGVIYRETP